MGYTGLDVGVMTPTVGGIIGLAYGGGIDSALSVLLVPTELRLNVATIRLSGTDTLRTARVLQVRAVFDFSGAIPFTHLQPEVETSSRTSESHFLPLCRLKTIRSEANQADTAARPKELKAEKTVVIVDVTGC